MKLEDQHNANLEEKPSGRDRRHTAIHEAGHTVARIRFGLGIGDTTIVPNGNFRGSANGQESWGSQGASEKEIMASCAGYAALVAAGFDESIAADGCAHDFDEATELIDFWQLSPLCDWQQKTVELMRQPENIRAVELLSNALMEHGTVGGDHADVFVARADGEITEAELLDFLTQWPVPNERPLIFDL